MKQLTLYLHSKTKFLVDVRFVKARVQFSGRNSNVMLFCVVSEQGFLGNLRLIRVSKG